MTIPEIIRHAINRRQCLVSNPLSPNSAIGQLRIVTKETPSGVIRRTVLVAGVNMENRTSIIMMTHPYEDLATDTDVVIPAGFEGVPYAIVVQTDCMGVFWTADLNKLDGEYVAEIGSEAVNQIRNLSHDSSYASDISFVNSGLRTGFDLRGPMDTRWEFKRNEGEEIKLLTQDCFNQVMLEADEASTILDAIEVMEEEIDQPQKILEPNNEGLKNILPGNFPSDLENIRYRQMEQMLQLEAA